MNAPDIGLAGRLAKICACMRFIDEPGGIRASPWYSSVGFDSLPKSYVVDADNACTIGACGDHAVLAFHGVVPLAYHDRDALLHSMQAWLRDADQAQIRVNGIEGRVQRGFADALLQLWPLFMEDLQARLAEGRTLIVTGHSKGGAVAALAASRLNGMELARAPRVYTFAAPRPGDPVFAQEFAETITAWRFEFQDDIVPHLPMNARDYLQNLDPHFREITSPTYASAGALEFVSWSGKIIAGNGSWLDAERARNLAQLLSDGKTDQLAAYHSLEASYLPALAGNSRIGVA